MAERKREHLLVTALQLFNEYGFHATGIDRVQAESGVSKTTMYKYFKSKDELIQAALEMRHEQFNAWISERMNSLIASDYAGRADGPLLALFDALNEWIHSDNFFGCNFINATAEFSDANHPIHQYACEHKRSVQQLVEDNLPPLNSDTNANELAKEICLLIDGAVVCAQTGLKDSATRAKDMALRLLAGYGYSNAV